MNNMLKLNKELIKLVNKCFNVNVNKFKFLTKANYGKGCICLIYGYEGKKFGIIITDKDMIIFCELKLYEEKVIIFKTRKSLNNWYSKEFNDKIVI